MGLNYSTNYLLSNYCFEMLLTQNKSAHFLYIYIYTYSWMFCFFRNLKLKLYFFKESVISDLCVTNIFYFQNHVTLQTGEMWIFCLNLNTFFILYFQLHFSLWQVEHILHFYYSFENVICIIENLQKTLSRRIKLDYVKTISGYWGF